MAQQLTIDYRQADLDAVDRALCDYAVQLTLHPEEMKPEHIEQLRDVGLSDEQISHAAQVVSYFNYINRIADGLGVDPEPDMKPSADQWRAAR